MRRQRIRLSQIKNPVKHSSTILANVGSGSIPTVHSVLFTDVGIRSATGGAQVIKDTASTDGTCNVGDIVKYTNMCIECAPRLLDTANNSGWLEWAVVFLQEATQLVGLTNLGISTLGDVCNKQFRNNCLLSGCMPMGTNQANSMDLKIKIPPQFQKLKVGSILILFGYFRSAASADVRTDSHRLLMSSIFKAYS